MILVSWMVASLVEHLNVFKRAGRRRPGTELRMVSFRVGAVWQIENEAIEEEVMSPEGGWSQWQELQGEGPHA